MLWTAALNIDVSRPVSCTDWRTNLASSGLFLRLLFSVRSYIPDKVVNSPLLEGWKIFQGQDALNTKYEFLFVTVGGSQHAPSRRMGGIGDFKLCNVCLDMIRCLLLSRVLALTGSMADICMSGLDLTRSSVMVRRVLPPICVSGLVGSHCYKMTYWLWKSHSVHPWLPQLGRRDLHLAPVLMVTKYMQIPSIQLAC